MPTKVRRAVIYIRVSKVGTRDVESANYQTEGEQERQCRLAAQMRGSEVVDVIVDRDVSGRKWDRKGLTQVMGMVTGGDVDEVIVYMISRLGRNVRGALETVAVMREHGVNLVSTKDEINLDSAVGRVMFNLMLSFAEYESDMRGESWEASVLNALARGVGPIRTPYGYARHEGGLLAGKLYEHPERGPWVRECFRMRAGGATYAELGRYLDEMEPGRNHDPSWIRELLQRRTYLGEIRRELASGEVQLVIGAHDALTDPLTFDRCGSVRTVTRSARTSHLLSGGVVVCDGCGMPLYGQVHKGQADTYRCRRVHRGKVCPAPVVIKAQALEEYVLGHVEAAVRARVFDGELGEDDGYDDLLRAHATAEFELLNVSGDDAYRKQLGTGAWRAMCDSLARERDELASRISDYRDEQDVSRLRGLDVEEVMGDRELTRAAIEATVIDARVKRGRTLSVEERVSLTLLAHAPVAAA